MGANKYHVPLILYNISFNVFIKECETGSVFTCVTLEADPETRIHFKQLSWEVTPENSIRGWVGETSITQPHWRTMDSVEYISEWSQLRDEEAGDFIHQHMAHWLKTVEPYTKVTGARPWTKATNVEPLTKVSSGTDWAIAMVAMSPPHLNQSAPWPHSLVAQMVKSLPAMWETWVRSLGWMIHWRRKWQPPPVFLPGKSHGWRSLAGYSPWGRTELEITERLHFHLHSTLTNHLMPFFQEEFSLSWGCKNRLLNGTPLQYSCLEKSHGRWSLEGCSPWGRWGSDTTEQLHLHFSLSCIAEGNGNPLQCFAWRIPGTGEPGGLPTMGSHRVGHDWSDLVVVTHERGKLCLVCQEVGLLCFSTLIISAFCSKYTHSFLILCLEILPQINGFKK